MVEVEEMEKLLEGWKSVKLAEVIVEVKERNIGNKENPVLSISNIYGFIIQNEFFSHNIHSKELSNYKIVKKKYFGYNPARINVGSIALNEKIDDGLVSPMYMVFQTKSNLIPQYLKYHIQRKYFNNQVFNNTAGSVRESLNFTALETFNFIFPEKIQEQQKITEVLENVDETIEKTDNIIKKYKRIKQGLMQDLLTRGITAFEFEKDKIINAVKKVFDNGDHRFGREENLVSHLSRHLENFFPEWAVDSEVEKNNERQRPDIIIHKRGTDNNLFAIEVKKNDNLNAIKEDIKKLENVMLGDYSYEDAIFIGFNIENFEDVLKLSEKVNFVLVSKNGEIKVKLRIRSFKDSSLGRIPEEWEAVELGKIFKLKSGDIKPSDTTEFGNYPVYGGNGILGFSENYNFNKETIIIGRVGEYCGVVNISKKGWITDNALYTVSKKQNYNNLFFYYLLNYLNLNQFSAETGQPLMTQSIVCKIKVTLPPLPEQHRITLILSQIDETIGKEQSYKNKYERIKQGLIEDLLTGKVRVNHLIKEGVESV